MKAEIININNGIRRYWNNICTYLENNFEEYELADIFYQQLEILKENNYRFYKLLVSVIFADHYKLLCFDHTYNKLSKEDKGILEYYNSLNSIDDLLNEFEQSDTMLSVMMVDGLDYNDYDECTKREIMTNAIPQDKFLFKMCPTHLYDKIEILKSYQAEDLLLFYKDYIYKCGEDFDTKNRALDSVLVTLESLYTYDKDNYEEVLTDMAATYYKWMKYLDSEPQRNLLDVNDKALIDIIEQNPIELVVELSNQLPPVLDIIVDGYLYYNTEKIEISNDVIDDYVKNNVNEDVKEKLKLNKSKIKSLDF
ncbi:MAG: hypothetical protein PHO63_03390 [Bacilli bacterium]|nr:hypothetical protein [Bacilli bacterium]MDD4808974.1 hypothetical protein [Bacilli bacterium]